MIIEDLKNHIATGVDAKIMQYEESATDISDDRIDIIDILGGKQNCILINMEKDKERYHSALKQLEKVSIKEFVHLKGTDGRMKVKTNLENDLTYILSFLSQFNSNIETKQIKINEFSEINDKSCQLQDGPLGCYCSHLRAMIYGYLNFEDYTIICEDDLSITNTEKIEKYIKQIPDDWDVICLNARPKNISYEEPFYRFTNEFHSCHFYIIRHKALKTIFEGMYPLSDQVDVLLSNMYPILNIYNIPDTVYQKNIKTNTQNNLHIIFSSPNYTLVKNALFNIEKILNQFANEILFDNEERNNIIVKNLIYDVLYNFILVDGDSKKWKHKDDFTFDNPYQVREEYKTLVDDIKFFIQCSRKGIEVNSVAQNLANVLLFTLSKFELHSDEVKAYSFGSTAHTYKSGNQIIKKYNTKLRWATEGHDNPEEIFLKESNMINRISGVPGCPKFISFGYMTITLEYLGESLYNDFNLPKDWKTQIEEIFKNLTQNNIFYPEFRLQNILVLDGKISFVDFGLSEFRSDCDNTENLNLFIQYLSSFEEKFKMITDLDERHRLISTFLINSSI